MIEQNEEWLVDCRYLSLDSLAPLLEERRGGNVDEEVRSSRPEPPNMPTSYATSSGLTRRAVVDALVRADGPLS